MNSMNSTEHLASIDTCWRTVQEAHAGPAGAAVPARQALVQRYHGPAQRYLFKAVHDRDAAEALSQEFALRLLRGDFRHANPENGRFRDYIKTALINLVNKYFRSQQQRPRMLVENAANATEVLSSKAAAPTCDEGLRQELLAQTWNALQKTQPRYYAVLRMRSEELTLSSSEMAERLTATSGALWTAEQVRKILERARAKFVDLLLDEVARRLHCKNKDDLNRALEELEILKYCRTAIQRRSGEGGGVVKFIAS
jgi:RNA polymerase sigma-70 factor (ECF subfamily)